jgi:rubrerythrin
MDKFCKQLNKMIKDEEKASEAYNLLIGLSDPVTRIVIEGIEKDEKKHRSALKKLKKLKCRRR